ncbi:hypothetical protein B0T14DRAFT_67719 [Immersiella caudata]|uniref:Uncharacterized protein n=1 Tax=Immersiella caudata TaxID=314043 RepID=A0AA40CDG5_9PEZI|nr:hypothetical protein B0T14DRAFT_67719 [Immersiella caudata]
MHVAFEGVESAAVDCSIVSACKPFEGWHCGEIVCHDVRQDSRWSVWLAPCVLTNIAFSHRCSLWRKVQFAPQFEQKERQTRRGKSRDRGKLVRFSINILPDESLESAVSGLVFGVACDESLPWCFHLVNQHEQVPNPGDMSSRQFLWPCGKKAGLPSRCPSIAGETLVPVQRCRRLGPDLSMYKMKDLIRLVDSALSPNPSEQIFASCR